jgi:hypothetical protein
MLRTSLRSPFTLTLKIMRVKAAIMKVEPNKPATSSDIYQNATEDGKSRLEIEKRQVSIKFFKTAAYWIWAQAGIEK